MRKNSHSLAFVWTGEGRITTQSGSRWPIDAGHELSRPFIADHGWLERRPEIAKLCIPFEDYKAAKAKAAKPTPTPAKAEEKPAKAAKRTPKRVTKPKE